MEIRPHFTVDDGSSVKLRKHHSVGPKVNNSIQKTRTPSSDSCEAEEDHSGVIC